MPGKSGNLKVLHVIPSVAACRGGPSQAVIEMVTALRKNGIDAEIATSNDNGNDTLTQPIARAVDYQGVPVRFFNRVSPPFRVLREFIYTPGLSRWLARHLNDYDLLHVHAIFSYCSTRAMQLARRQQLPYLVRPIGQLEQWSLQQSKLRKSAYLRFVERANLEQAASLHFTSESERTQARKVVQPTADSVIPLGLELPMQIRAAARKSQQRWSLERETPTIVFLSRLHPKKGLEQLLDALATLSELPFQLVIAGEGEEDYVASLKTRIQHLGLAQRCHFVGFVRGAEKNLLLQGADLFALTSHSENFGIAVLEAMAAGTAVLVSDKVALSEQVTNHDIGYVCTLAADDIKHQLHKALTDLEKTRERGEAARRYVEQTFQWSRIAQQLDTLYHRCIATV